MRNTVWGVFGKTCSRSAMLYPLLRIDLPILRNENRAAKSVLRGKRCQEVVDLRGELRFIRLRCS